MGEMALAIESPRHFDIRLNGTRIDPDQACGWWVEPAIERVPIPPSALCEGLNELILTLDYDADCEGLEAIYLLGGFGARAKGLEVVLTSQPVTLVLGDWTQQGLFFYSGNVVYRRRVAVRPRPGERVFLCLPDYAATAVRVQVNGCPAGIVAWEPNEIDITACLDGAGMVDLALEVLGSRRNAFGPLHTTERYAVGIPRYFETTGVEWVAAFQTVPYGLMKSPVISYRR